MSAMVTNETTLKGIVCLYRYSPHSPGDGYYEIKTEQGDFLENVDQSELAGELRNYREQGYTLSKVGGGGVA